MSDAKYYRFVDFANDAKLPFIIGDACRCVAQWRTVEDLRKACRCLREVTTQPHHDLTGNPEAWLRFTLQLGDVEAQIFNLIKHGSYNLAIELIENLISKEQEKHK